MKTYKKFLREETTRQIITEDKIGKAISLYKDIINIKNKMSSINQNLANSIFTKLDDILEHYKGNIERKNWDRIIVKDFIIMMSDRIKKIIGNLKSNLTNKIKKFTDEQKRLIRQFIDYLERLVREINNFYKIATN